MNKTEILQTLHLLSGEIRQNYKAEIVGIFGSYARGEETPNSDIDVLVNFLDKASIFDLVGLGNFLEKKFERKVDVVSKRALRKEIAPYVHADLIQL
jgi:predicted nucleotidyltransferase